MYDINGKVYTDVTFVDEMVHNIKLILNGIVIKNSELADTNETEESIRLSDIYLSIKRGTKTFELFDYTYKYLSQIEDFSEDEIINYEISVQPHLEAAIFVCAISINFLKKCAANLTCGTVWGII